MENTQETYYGVEPDCIEKYKEQRGKDFLEYEDFKSIIFMHVKKAPECWRRGQSVFNYMEIIFGDIARRVQFEDGIDCFYRDDKIDEFIDACWVYFAQEQAMEINRKAEENVR